MIRIKRLMFFFSFSGEIILKVLCLICVEMNKGSRCLGAAKEVGWKVVN